MTKWREILIKPKQSLLSTIETIDRSILQIALVVDENNLLLGTVTDGDIRRALLKGLSMTEPIDLVMNRSPYSVLPDYDKEELKITMTARHFRQVPVLTEDREVIDLVVIDDLLKGGLKHENWVVLMAGGLGTRLHPITENLPKPLVKIDGKPILESILERFVSQGFSRFFISVNYKAELIKEYFGDGEAWNVDISYIDENEPLGTAGSIGLIKEEPDIPIIVMNGDLMTDINFSKMLDFHHEHGAMGTMGVREYDFQVQFGVIELAEGRLLSINEKPVHKFLVNAGIYVLEPSAVADISTEQKIDMTTLFNKWASAGRNCVAFPVHEYWLDVGRLEDLEIAKRNARN